MSVNKMLTLFGIISFALLIMYIIIHTEKKLENVEIKGVVTEMINENQTSKDDEIFKQILSIDELKKYVKTMPFSKNSLDYLYEKVDRECEILEYSIKKELGQKELDRIKQRIK